MACELPAVAGCDLADQRLVLQGELLLGDQLASDPAAVDRMGAHEALSVLRDGGVRALFVVGLKSEQDHHRLKAELVRGLELGLDGGLAGEGVEIRHISLLGIRDAIAAPCRAAVSHNQGRTNRPDHC